MFSGLSIGHIALLALIIILLFGSSKLRHLGKDLGSAVKGFKDTMREGEANNDTDEQNKPKNPPTDS